jgi:protein phosphatase
MALLTDVGCQRAVNEDAGVLIHPSGQQKDLLAVVSDGMGGYQGGEVASRLAIDVVCRAYYDETGPPAQRLLDAVAAANRAIYDMSSQNQQLAGMGTTCTALALCEDAAYMAHVGDSRLYLIRNGSIYQMTEDHSLVMDLVRRGVITAQGAREHPDRNILQRALGRQPEVEISTWREGTPLQVGDRYLLCSDGLSGVLTDEIIREAALGDDPPNACAALIDLARRAGAPDNVTVGIIKISKTDEENALLPPTRELEAVASENKDDRLELEI